MKFFAAFVAVLAVAVASPLGKPLNADDSQVAAIIAAIQSPNTDAATAVLLEQQLLDIIASANPVAVGPAIIDPTPIAVEEPSPIAVGPAIVEQPSPIAVGPAIVEFPVEASPEVVPSPVIVIPSPDAVPESSIAPLVQIILNINQANPEVIDIPIEIPVAVDPVTVVDHAPIETAPVVVAPAPVDPSPVVVAPAPVDPVIVVPEAVEPVLVGTPILPEPVIIGTPVVVPTPVITLPEALN